MTLKGKVCLITGGSRGIGAATALQVAAAGADVCINARHDDPAAHNILCAIEQLGRRGHLVCADLRDPAAAQLCVEETSGVLGYPDILVHSAGGPAPGNILEVTPENWYAAFDVHLHAAFHLCRAALPSMREKKQGAIIFISSVAGLRGCPNSVAYSVVKGALPQLARSLARDFAASNIRVNCVAPGVIRTRFQEHLTTEQVHNNVENRIPLHREGTPEQVAEIVLALIQNDFITGETVTIDGGMSMRIV